MIGVAVRLCVTTSAAVAFIESFRITSLRIPFSRIDKKYIYTEIFRMEDKLDVNMDTLSSTRHLEYVDVHAHVFHEEFRGDEDLIVSKCKTNGLEFVVVNGLEPHSNREVLALCDRHPSIYLPAIGIYPVDAACNVITHWEHDFPPSARFDVDAEIDFIDQMASEKRIVAVGECGLDKHYVTDDICMAEQERVLRKLMRVAKKHDIPIILHSRKAEARCLELLIEEEVQKADFHCFCGKTKLGQQIAAAGYYLSIPSVVERSHSFQQLVEKLPLNRILTETDCPYQGPDKGERNDPSTIPRGVQAIAQVRCQAKNTAPIRQSCEAESMLSSDASFNEVDNITRETQIVKLQIRHNFRTLFGR
jgi:TatD DNase family protein